MKPDMELLSKAQVIREYNYPVHQLENDLATKRIPHFRSQPPVVIKEVVYPQGTYYIPRAAVEQRLRELCGMTEG